MPRMPFPISQGFYVDESLPISSQQCVNLYPHIPQAKTITDGALIGTSGISLAGEAYGAQPIRGLQVAKYSSLPTAAETAFLIDVDKIYQINDTTYGRSNVTGGTATILGSDPVITASDGNSIMIVAPDVAGQFNAWIWAFGGSDLFRIADADFLGNVNFVTYMDGYYIFSKTGSNVFFISELRDGRTYNALDFASAESDPDSIVALMPLNGLLYIFGAKTFEQWQNVGGSGFPFTKITSGVQQKGCTAPRSLVEFNTNLVWIGAGANERPAIWATNGGIPIKLSTPAIDFLINSGGIDLLRLAYQCHWAENGNNFIAFTVPTICTVIYNTTTQLWHEAKSFDINLNEIPWRVTSLVSAYSVFIVADSEDGRLGVMDAEVYTEYDNNINSYFTCPAMDNNGNPFTVNSVELMMETGLAPISGNGSNPIVRMAVSTDCGRTFSPDISREMGMTGNYEQRISWDLLGRYSRSFTPKFICDEPIKKVFVKGEIVIGS